MQILKIKFNKLIAMGIAIVLFAAIGFVFFNRPKETAAGWWNDSWSYRKAITINHNKVAGDLTNFFKNIYG